MHRILLATILLGASPAAAGTFMGYECNGDCSGHVAGHDWASDEEITELKQCFSAKSQSFAEGCMAYLDDEIGDDQASDPRYVSLARTDFKKSLIEAGAEALHEYSLNCWDATGTFVDLEKDLTYTEACFYVDVWATSVSSSFGTYFSVRQAVARADRNLTAIGAGKGMRAAILVRWARQAFQARPLD